MIRRRNNVRNQGREKIIEPEHDYSEPEGHMRSKRWGYETRKPERYHSEYNFNTYEDRYNGWKDVYRDDEYSIYDSQYDSDDDASYRYNSRSIYYDDYYDTPKYYSYYDQYDSAFKEDRSHSECKTCNKHGKRGRGRMFDDPSSLYRYEEDRPKYRDNSHSYKQKNKTNTPAVANHARLGNNMDIYAISNILNQKGFKYRNRYSTTEATETEIDSEGYKGRIQKRKRKPGYHVYTTQTSVASVFDKKMKHRYPEKLISVTDYEEKPMLEFKNKNKRGHPLNDESDLVYLPVVMKTKYKKGKASEQNLNNLKTNRKDITVYTVSNRPSNVFRKAHTYSNNLKKIESNTKNDFTDQIPKTEYPLVYTASEVRNNNIMSLVANQNIRKSGLRKSSIQPTHQSGVNDRRSSAVGQQRVSGLQNMDTKNKNSQLKSIIKRSIAVPKNTRVSKASYANNQPYLGSNLLYPKTSTTDFDTEGQFHPQSVFKKSTADPRSHNIGGRRKSSVFGQTSSISNLQNYNFPNENVQKSFGSMNNVLIPSQSSIEGIESMTSPQRSISNIQTLMINQNTIPKGILRQASNEQSQTGRRRSLAGPEQMFDYSGHQTTQNSVAKQGSVARTTQGFVASDQILGIEGGNVQKSIIRQGSVARRGQSFVGNEQVIGVERENKQKSIAGNSVAPEIGQSIQNHYDVMGIEDPSAPKSIVRQSIGTKIGQSYVGRDQVMGTEGQNIHKSMIRQSAAKRGQSFVDRDQLITTEEDNTKRSMARLQNTAPQSHASFINKDEGQNAQRSMIRNISKTEKDQNFIDRNQTTGTEMNNTQKSITRRRSVARRGQSFVDSAQIIGVEGDNKQKSVARQSFLPEGERNIVDRGEVMGIEDQSTMKSMARQSSVAQRKQSIGGQNRPTQKSTVRQSSVAQRGQSFVDSAQIIGVEGDNKQKSTIGQRVLTEGEQMIVDGGEVTGIEGQSTTKSMARQSSVGQRKQSIGGQNTQKSMVRQSSVAQRGQSLVDGTQTVETENRSTPKSMVRQSSVAQRDQTYLGGRKSGLQEIEIPNQQPQVSVLGPSATYKYGQQENSVVRQQSPSINEQGEVADNPQKTVEKHGKQPQQSAKFKRPLKTKSKSLLKKALNKFSAFQGQSEKINHSESTTPILDVILNEANVEPRIEYQRLPSFPQPNEPLSTTSIESFDQPKVSKKSKKSTKSKLKSLLWKPKKSESKQRPKLTMITNQPSDEQQQSSPSEFYQTSDQSANMFPPTSERSSDLPDADVTSENQEPKESSDHIRNFFGTTLKGYDLTPIIYFLHIAQLIVGVTMFEKLMEVLEVF